MIFARRADQFSSYQLAREFFLSNPNHIIEIEELLAGAVRDLIESNLRDITADYDEASYLYPFWANSPPEDRGRKPVADQYPWIEVGEHAVGSKLLWLLNKKYCVRDAGLPSGSDLRVVLKSPSIKAASGGYTDSAWLFIDIKSVGPRDDKPHTVMSHNQMSGDGVWSSPDENLANSVVTATGARATHDFRPSLPPIVVLSDATVLPVVTIAVKPVYCMIPSHSHAARNLGQPLARIDIAAIPNGLLLFVNPNYLQAFPTLLFPGKDDKSKDVRKLRARVSFALLAEIADWRVRKIFAD